MSNLFGNGWAIRSDNVKSSHLLLGTFSREDGDIAGAKNHYREALKQITCVGKSKSHPTLSTVLYKLGCVAYDEEDYETAV